MKHRLHHYPDEASLRQRPPSPGSCVAVAGRLGRYVGITGPHLWVAWTLSRDIYRMMRTVYETVVARDYRLTTNPQPRNI